MSGQIFRATKPINELANQASEIERRRERMDERTKRILDPKQRQFGVDTEALEHQIRETQQQTLLERQRDVYYDDQANKNAGVCSQMESMHQMEVRERALELNNFRTQQAKEKRRKDQVKNSGLPDNLDMDTPFLKFLGEDTQKAERVKYQQLQQRDWLAQQVLMLQNQQAFDEGEDANLQAKEDHVLEHRYKVEEMAAQQRRQRNEEQAHFHKMQALEKRNREDLERARNQEESATEIRNTMQSQFMNEGVNATHGPKGFKGFTPAQRQRILDEQAQQIVALREKQEKELRQDVSYDVYQERVRQAGTEMDKAKVQNARRAEEQLRKDQQVQMREKAKRYNYLDSVVYTNPVKEEYFQQFQQSSY